MKCPLLAIAWAAVVAKQQENYPACLKEDCAWWSPIARMCALRAIDLSLLGCHVEMVKIAKELTLVRGK